jgi:protein-tyrosine phosphatase
VRAEVFLIPEVPVGRLAIMPRPRAGDWLEDEVASWQSSRLDIVVSLLEDDEVTELGLGDEPAVCERFGVRLLRFPIPDRGVPASYPAASELVTRLVTELRSGRGIGIHCRIGVGRFALMAVSLLAALGIPVESAWASVARARGLSVPDTPAQRAWVASAKKTQTETVRSSHETKIEGETRSVERPSGKLSAIRVPVRGAERD